MAELLAAYSLAEIVAILVTVAAAIKGFVSFGEWVDKRLKKRTSKAISEIDKDKKLEARLSLGSQTMQNLKQEQQEIRNLLENLSTSIKLLIESDKDDIKSYITECYHHFMKQGWIDDYSLDCLEKRFSHYVQEGGNSFIEDLMKDLRKLPKVSADKSLPWE